MMFRKKIDAELRQANLMRPASTQTPALLFALTAMAIFVAEAGLMLFLEVFREKLTTWQQALLDPLLLIAVLFPLLYLLVFRPMRQHMTELFRIGKQLEEEVNERREAEAALRQSEKQLHLLSAQLLTTQEEERKRVARELHENLGQSLVALKWQLILLERGNKQDDVTAAQYAFRIASQQIDDVVRHIRTLSRDLSPAILEDLGFTTAARRLVTDCARNANLNTTVSIGNVDAFLKASDAILTYRVLQEALENVENHAHARHLAVTIRENEGNLLLVVEDDGEGFVPNRQEVRGLGLATMYERARMLGSSLDLWSSPGAGTRITLQIPRRADTAVEA